jgi:hypothetical protein
MWRGNIIKLGLCSAEYGDVRTVSVRRTLSRTEYQLTGPHSLSEIPGILTMVLAQDSWLVGDPSLLEGLKDDR